MVPSVALLLLQLLPAQEILPAPAHFHLDGDLSEWGLKPRTLAYSPQGLILAGHRSIPVPSPADSHSVRLALHFAYPNTDPSDEQYWCQALDPGQKEVCERWLAEQSGLRTHLRTMFEREWLLPLSPSSTTPIAETRATKAWSSLTEHQRQVFGPLNPLRQPRPRIQTRISASNDPRTIAYTFELLIPWDALPPVNRTAVDEVFIATDDVTSPAPYRITPALTLRMTPCELPLSGEAFAFLPKSIGDPISTLFRLDTTINWMPGMMPQPDWLAPTLKTEQLMSHRLPDGVGGGQICGSSEVTAYRGPNQKASQYLRFGGALRAKNVQVRNLPGNWKLIADGPVTGVVHEQSYSYCAGCPWTHFTVFAVGPDGRFVDVLTLSNRIGDMLSDYKIEVAPDLRTIRETLVDLVGRPTQMQYCLQLPQVAYKPCVQ
ncbi:hypothetical protein F183_A05580 [Bryobacterales bacterium F-183]|nr:hypothetical protein F183_A05580 [Bryobacterales bacterium F-183]